LNPDEKQLWHTGTVECVMVSCCAGAELQLRRIRGAHSVTDVDDDGGGREILLRELYPTKSDLYERARMLHRQHTDPDQPDSSA
jgi:hypothetical protein